MTARPHLRRRLVEGCLIAAAGAAFALVANALSPRGLALRRDYFPTAAAPGVFRGAGTPAAVDATTGHDARLAQRGLRTVAHDRAVELFRDPRYSAGLVVFVDARDDGHYQAGHIPGAIQLDHYRLERHASTVLAACLVAEQVVVYCNGGTCEDSELAAADLLDFGIPAAKIRVYGGGMAEWQRRGLPVETGPRGSGTLPPP